MSEKPKKIIDKLRALSENQKIAIIVVVVIISSLGLGYFWIQSAMNSISKIGESMQSVDLPKIDIPQDVLSGLPSQTDVVGPSDGNIINNSPQTSDASTLINTDDWKIYTNDKYSFEIKYPSNLLIKESSPDTGFTYANFKDNEHYPFWVYSGDSKNKNINNIMNPMSSDYNEIKNGKLSIGNVNWNTIEKIDIPSEGLGTAGSSLIFYTQKEDSTYLLECVNCNTDVFGIDSTSRKSIFDKMLSTFKFIK